MSEFGKPTHVRFCQILANLPTTVAEFIWGPHFKLISFSKNIFIQNDIHPIHCICLCGLVVCTPDFHPGGRGSIPLWNFYNFFHFFQTLGAKKGHTRHVLPCLLYTTELCIIQRSFWHRSDSYAMICKILTLVREIRHFWRYFMSFSYFLPSQNFCSAIRASYPIQKPVLRQKNIKIRIILKGPPNNCAPGQNFFCPWTGIRK